MDRRLRLFVVIALCVGLLLGLPSLALASHYEKCVEVSDEVGTCVEGPHPCSSDPGLKCPPEINEVCRIVIETIFPGSDPTCFQ